MMLDGNYTARATQWALTESKSGAAQITVIFEVEGGETVTYRGSLDTEKVIVGQSGNTTPFEITLKQLRALGWRGDDVAALASTPVPTAPIQIRLKTTTGRDGTQFQNVSISTFNLNQFALDAGKARQLSAHLKGQIKAFDAVNRTAPAPTPQRSSAPNASAQDDADIPF